MGLLDDAIREHLDLKRRRGADPDEVARQENEALGPPRTGQFATPADDVQADATMEPGLDEETRHYAWEEVEPTTQEHVDPAASVAAELYEESAEADAGDDEEWLDEPAEAPRTVVEPTRAERPPSEVSETEPTADEPAAEDVLEETPDFLQETPEHDRLWFEQRPPRDFDFDK
jgi:hypothetical protein